MGSNSGEWEEVRWFSVDNEETRWFPKEYQDVTVARLKYRTQGFGGTVLMDDYFVVSNGKVVENGSKSGLEGIAANNKKISDLEEAMQRDQTETVKFMEEMGKRRIPSGSQGTMPGKSN